MSSAGSPAETGDASLVRTLPSPEAALCCHPIANLTQPHRTQAPSSADVAESETAARAIVLMKGFLRKKSPKGIPGFKAWQQRYFELTPETIRYYHDDTKAKNLGAIPVLMIDTIDVSKLAREYRFDLILKGEYSRKFALRASSMEEAKRWRDIIIDTKDKLGKCGNDMRKFSKKYWKESDSEGGAASGPSPVERALAHLEAKDTEVKQLKAINAEKPELYLLTSALLHGLRTSLKEHTIKRMLVLTLGMSKELKVDSDRKVQVTADLFGRSGDATPCASLTTPFVNYVNGHAGFNTRLEFGLPGMLLTREAFVRITFRTRRAEVGQLQLTVMWLLGNLGEKTHFLNGRRGCFELTAAYATELDQELDKKEYRFEQKYEYVKQGTQASSRGSREMLTIPPELPSLREGQFKAYAPKVFARIQSLFGTECGQFFNSICNNAFVEFVSNSKSGAFFFFSSDGRYMVKTIEQGECKCLRQMLPEYYEHCRRNPGTLLCKFYGLYRLRCNKRTHYFIIMESVFNTNKFIHLILDLKGSTTNRNATEKDLQATPTESFTGTILKDNDIRDSSLQLDVGDVMASALRINLDSDVKFLAKQGIIDYSLLVGIHYPDVPIPKDATSAPNGESGEDSKRAASTSGGSGAADGKRAAAAGRPGPHKRKHSRRLSNPTGVPIPSHYRTKIHNLSIDGSAPGSALAAAAKESRPKDDVGNGIRGAGARKEVYYIGIIDILIQFGIFKGGEYIYKAKLKGKGQKISVIPPKEYGKRFLKFMNYFITG